MRRYRRYRRGVRFSLESDSAKYQELAHQNIRKLYAAFDNIVYLADALQRVVNDGQRIALAGMSEARRYDQEERYRRFKEDSSYLSSCDALLSATTSWAKCNKKSSGRLW